MIQKVMMRNSCLSLQHSLSLLVIPPHKLSSRKTKPLDLLQNIDHAHSQLPSAVCSHCFCHVSITQSYLPPLIPQVSLIHSLRPCLDITFSRGPSCLFEFGCLLRVPIVPWIYPYLGTNYACFNLPPSKQLYWEYNLHTINWPIFSVQFN